MPFCRRKCLYCDFYSQTDLSLTDSYVKAVVRNIRAANITADTVYFGGGTPSLLSGAQIYDILSAADISADAEISAECNPDSTTLQLMRDFRAAGINRLSIGIQSFNDDELKMMGRLHNSRQTAEAIQNAQKAGFENISADLMLGLPYQTEETVRDNIRKLAELNVTHISAYMLKIEENTPLAGCPELVSAAADNDKSADIYLMAVDMLAENGFGLYEISNFAKAGYECRHNLKYWRCEEYFGTGPSAHSCMNGKRFYVPRDIAGYISSPRQQEIISDESPCTEEEKMMLALRLSEGCDISGCKSKENIIKAAKPMEHHGLLKINGDRIILTPEGFLLSNEIICRLTDEL